MLKGSLKKALKLSRSDLTPPSREKKTMNFFLLKQDYY